MLLLFQMVVLDLLLRLVDIQFGIRQGELRNLLLVLLLLEMVPMELQFFTFLLALFLIMERH